MRVQELPGLLLLRVLIKTHPLHFLQNLLVQRELPPPQLPHRGRLYGGQHRGWRLEQLDLKRPSVGGHHAGGTGVLGFWGDALQLDVLEGVHHVPHILLGPLGLGGNAPAEHHALHGSERKVCVHWAHDVLLVELADHEVSLLLLGFEDSGRLFLACFFLFVEVAFEKFEDGLAV